MVKRKEVEETRAEESPSDENHLAEESSSDEVCD